MSAIESIPVSKSGSGAVPKPGAPPATSEHTNCRAAAAATSLKLDAITGAEPLTGTMRCVCSYCKTQYATKPCEARYDGVASHGCCPECFVIQSARLDHLDQRDAGPK